MRIEISADQFEAGLELVLCDMSKTEVLAMPGVLEILREECNNEAIDRAVEAWASGLGVAVETYEAINVRVPALTREGAGEVLAEHGLKVWHFEGGEVLKERVVKGLLAGEIDWSAIEEAP